MIELNDEERRIIDYALCFLNANIDDDNCEALEMSNETIVKLVLNIKKKL